MKFYAEFQDIPVESYPLRAFFWTDGSNEYSTIDLEKPRSSVCVGVSQGAASTWLNAQCLSTSSSQMGVKLYTWHGSCSVQLKGLNQYKDRSLALSSVAHPYPKNGELCMTEIQGVNPADEGPRYPRNINDKISQMKNKNVGFLNTFKAIDPANQHEIDTKGSEFYDIFFLNLNNLKIPVSHVLLTPSVYIENENIVRRLIEVTNSRFFTTLENIDGDHLKEGDYLSYLLLYLVNFTTYCEDWNIKGRSKRLTEKVRPNLQLTSAGDCEDTALYLHFFYEMILNGEFKDDGVKKIKEIARRYVPFVQLGAVGSHRMQTNGNYSKPKGGGASEFQAHSYFQLMPVSFVLENMHNGLKLDKVYNFDTQKFEPPLQHLIVEGTNLSVTSQHNHLSMPQSAIFSGELGGRYKTMKSKPGGFYNFMLIGISGMFRENDKGDRKPLQFIYKKGGTNINYGTSYQDSISIEPHVYQIYPTGFYDQAEIEISKHILSKELPIYIDGRIDGTIHNECHNNWLRIFKENGIATTKDKIETGDSEAFFSVYEALDYETCSRVCSELRKGGVKEVCLAVECVGKGLWGISLGIPQVIQSR